MAHLARAGVEVPAPEPDRTGALFSLLNGKPASLVTRIDGAPVSCPRRSIAWRLARRWRDSTWLP
jgi:homoserine kinase type II